MKEKVLELKESQRYLKSYKPSKNLLKTQQKALKRGLLLNHPKPKEDMEKRMKLQEDQNIRRDLSKQRKKDMEKEKRILKELHYRKYPKNSGLFLKKKKRMR